MKPTLVFWSILMAATGESALTASTVQQRSRYYAHDVVEDEHGVIAPWYNAQNGQWDARVRVAAETLKRYPWAMPPKVETPAPEYIWNGAWSIAASGEISVPTIENWANGDAMQRAAYVLGGLVDYYRYTGDAAALAHIHMTAETLLNDFQTDDQHPWPGFLISVPTKGRVYGQADPAGMIQLDIVAEVGLYLLRAYQITGNERWLHACQRWGRLLAEKRNRRPGEPPWGRYANPEAATWEDHMTGGVAFLLEFFDELLRLEHDDEIQAARQAGVAYLRDVLLPNWLGEDTWGRNYWDWACHVQVENVTEFVARYLIEHPEEFPTGATDARNVLTLFLNRTSVAGEEGGDTFHGAWAYPESSGCCGLSFWYGPLELAPVYAQLGHVTGNAWASEMARRQMILATYDFHPTGVVEDSLVGWQIVAGAWFKIAHPMALKHVLNAIAWQPETFGAARENHIVRSTRTVSHVEYAPGKIAYRTHDAPKNNITVLRLAFEPARVTAGGRSLPRRDDLVSRNGYTVQPLDDGDFLVTIRHDNRDSVVVEGPDPQQSSAAAQMAFEGDWHPLGEDAAVATTANATATFRFVGNQIRVIGDFDPQGGIADVYLDGVRQMWGFDSWSPYPRQAQTLFYQSGLADSEHELRIVARGQGNPLSEGARICLRSLQWSQAQPLGPRRGAYGPVGVQRFICGYPSRAPYIDSGGNPWLPCTEFVVRLGSLQDSVAHSWITKRTTYTIAGTDDMELYRYGIRAPEFWINATVDPGPHYVRLKFAEHRYMPPLQRAATILINGEIVAQDVDILAMAGGLYRAVDLVFNDIQPRHGIIEVRLVNSYGGAAMLQALEVGPGHSGQPNTVATVSAVESQGQNLLANPDFEHGVAQIVGGCGHRVTVSHWTYVLAGLGTDYCWNESAYSVHPEWGLPLIHSGSDALRTHTEGNGYTLVYQDVPVQGNTAYTASVWVHAVDLHGQGFGRHPHDSAALLLHEGTLGNVWVWAHQPVACTQATDGYVELRYSFITQPNTTFVRFALATRQAAHYTQSHVTYDNCRLVRDATPE